MLRIRDRLPVRSQTAVGTNHLLRSLSAASLLLAPAIFAQPNPSAGLVLTPATFSVLNPSIFGDYSPVVIGASYGHRPDAKTYLFSVSLSHARFQFGRTFWPDRPPSKTLMTGLDYGRPLFSRELSGAVRLVSGVQGSVGYGIVNSMAGVGTEGVIAGILLPVGARFSTRGFRLTPYLAPGYFFARESYAGFTCNLPSDCPDVSNSGLRFSFGGGLRLDLFERLSLEAGIRKTQTPHAISRRSYGMSYRLGNLDGSGLRDAGTFVLQMDNDFLARHTPLLDEDYTQGFHFSFNRKGGPRALRRAVATFDHCPTEQSCAVRTSILAGQEIYTPRYYPSPADDDRPFAGWLYGGLQSSASTDTDLASLSVKVGVTGPPSLAEHLQVTFHQMMPTSAVPSGWSNQLKFEPGLIVTASKKNLTEAQAGLASFGLITSGAASLGNILTDIEAGFTLRAGLNAEHPWNMEKHHGVGGHASIGARGDIVLHSLFLDGNTFRSGPRVTRVPLVWQHEAGVGVSIGSTSVDYRRIVRSREFTDGPRYHSYGTISLTRRGAF
jgi:lipid A 3-O-deacylase